MLGTGVPEFVIIVLVALLLFGPAILTFWLGYVMGQNRAATKSGEFETDPSDATDLGSEENNDE
jgi:Sec-independent protein translocase protein TatA